MLWVQSSTSINSLLEQILKQRDTCEKVVTIKIWWASALTQSLNSLFIGFFGIYCFIDDLPLNGIIASSIEFSHPGL